MSPGTYLRKRREAAGVSIDKILAGLFAEPHLPERDRRAVLLDIESDLTPASATTLAVLHQFYRFDGEVYDRLVDRHHYGAALPAPRLCRECGCSQLDPCSDAWGNPCGWADADLCSRCAGGTPLAAVMPVPAGNDAASIERAA